MRLRAGKTPPERRAAGKEDDIARGAGAKSGARIRGKDERSCVKKAGVLLQELRDGVHDAVLCGLYGEDLPRQRERFSRAVETFAALCGDVPAGVCSAPGRTEICGNHLDHQRGCVIAAAVNAKLSSISSSISLRLLSD